MTGYAYLDAVLDQPGVGARDGAPRAVRDTRTCVGLENTLHAFRHAVALGYRYLETDVHVTRDGRLVAFHDDVLDRMTDRPGAIADPWARRAGRGAHRR